MFAGISLPRPFRFQFAYPQSDPADQSTTVIPILLAVPAIMLIAVSTEAAFKSGIFISAISLSLSFVIVATFVLFGTPDPDFQVACLL